MGYTPDQVRAMSPLDYYTVVLGWNAAHSPQAKKPPSIEDHERIKKYVDARQ